LTLVARTRVAQGMKECREKSQGAHFVFSFAKRRCCSSEAGWAPRLGCFRASQVSQTAGGPEPLCAGSPVYSRTRTDPPNSPLSSTKKSVIGDDRLARCPTAERTAHRIWKEASDFGTALVFFHIHYVIICMFPHLPNFSIFDDTHASRQRGQNPLLYLFCSGGAII